MKKISILVIISFILTGCATYVPAVSKPPKDQAKFDADVAACEKEKQKRQEITSNKHQGDSALMGGFGLLGATIVSAKQYPNDDYFKSPKQMIDECMTAKGYKVIQ